MMDIETQSYYDSDCNEKHCFFCSVLNRLHFILRGLPIKFSKINDSNNGIDSNYIFIPRFHHNEEIRLEGYFDHKIRKNNATKNWEIISVSSTENIVVGILRAENQLPFGKRFWKLSRRDALQNHDKVVLKLSMVGINVH